jgi:hypothetical protein
MRLQKDKKLTKNSSFLAQAPNRKQALKPKGRIFCSKTKLQYHTSKILNIFISRNYPSLLPGVQILIYRVQEFCVYVFEGFEFQDNKHKISLRPAIS